MADGTPNSNQRVTNVQLRSDINHLRGDLEGFTGRIEKCYEEEKSERMKLEERVRANKVDIARLDERQKNANRLLGLGEGLIVAALAAVGISGKS